MSDKEKKNATSFKPGKSGNPGGRSPRVGPNGETLTQLARAHTVTALESLVDVCNDREHPQRVAAATAILDRGWGKPKESVDIDANVKSTGIPIIQIVRSPAVDAED